MWNNRLQDLYCIQGAETILNIDDCDWNVTYNQQQNQFEVLTVELVIDRYPEEDKDMEYIFNIAEVMLQEEHEKNFDYGNEL